MEAAFEVRSVDANAGFRLVASGDDDGSHLAVAWSRGCEASTAVAVGRDGLSDFFKGMAQDWRGWDGTRSYAAHAPGTDYGAWAFRLDATSDGRGHVTLTVQVGEPWLPVDDDSGYETHIGFPPPDEPGTWRSLVMVRLEAGQLDGLAEAAAALPDTYRGHW